MAANATPPDKARFEPDTNLALRLASYSMLAGAALAPAGAALAADEVHTITPASLPYKFDAPPPGNDVKGVTQMLGMDADSDGQADFTFMTFYANVFDPAAQASWTTIKVAVIKDGYTFAHKSNQPGSGHHITSRACNSAVIAAKPSGPGIDHKGGFTHRGNYLTYYRKARVSCPVESCGGYRTYIYDDGGWSDDPGQGAIAFRLSDNRYGWVHVDLGSRTTAATLLSVTVGEESVTVTGIDDQTACLKPEPSASLDEEAATQMASPLELPLPDGSVPMTVGLLASGAAGNKLWRDAQRSARDTSLE